MARSELIQLLTSYKSSFVEEQLFVPRFVSLLRNFPDCFSRRQQTGHITGSAWILNENGSKALLVHHRKLNKWLQPGGHADGEEDVRQVALKEATEETGLLNLVPATADIFDVDIHLIPSRKNVPAHFHYDIRFAFIAPESATLVVSEESHALAWVAMEKIPFLTQNSQSIRRMILKSNSIF